MTIPNAITIAQDMGNTACIERLTKLMMKHDIQEVIAWIQTIRQEKERHDFQMTDEVSNTQHQSFQIAYIPPIHVQVTLQTGETANRQTMNEASRLCFIKAVKMFRGKCSDLQLSGEEAFLLN